MSTLQEEVKTALLNLNNGIKLKSPTPNSIFNNEEESSSEEDDYLGGKRKARKKWKKRWKKGYNKGWYNFYPTTVSSDGTPMGKYLGSIDSMAKKYYNYKMRDLKNYNYNLWKVLRAKRDAAAISDINTHLKPYVGDDRNTI